MDKIDIRDLIIRELKKEEIQVDNYNDAVFEHDYLKVAESVVEKLPIYVVSQCNEQLMAMLTNRVLTIQSEPDGIVRETMINNLLIDINCG